MYLSLDGAFVVLEPIIRSFNTTRNLRAIEPAILILGIADSCNSDGRVDANADYLVKSTGHLEELAECKDNGVVLCPSFNYDIIVMGS